MWNPPEWRWFVTHLVTANFYSCARASLFFGTSAQLHRNSLISHSPPIIKPDKGIKTKHSARVCTVVSLKRLVEWFVDKTKPSLGGAGSGSHFLKYVLQFCCSPIRFKCQWTFVQLHVNIILTPALPASGMRLSESINFIVRAKALVFNFLLLLLLLLHSKWVYSFALLPTESMKWGNKHPIYRLKKHAPPQHRNIGKRKDLRKETQHPDANYRMIFSFPFNHNTKPPLSHCTSHRNWQTHSIQKLQLNLVLPTTHLHSSATLSSAWVRCKHRSGKPS